MRWVLVICVVQPEPALLIKEVQSSAELKRAVMTWLDHGQKLLIRCCLESQRQTSSTSIPFPLTSFVALFGGPGMHGYGSHEVDNEKVYYHKLILREMRAYKS